MTRVIHLPPSPTIPTTEQALAWLSRPYGLLRECAAELGEAFTLDLGAHGKYVLFSNPAVIREVFTGDTSLLYAGKGNEVLRSVLGSHSLLLLEEERHLAHRRLLLPAFQGGRIARHTELMCCVAKSRIDGWKPGWVLDAQEVMQEITLDVILRVIFGTDEGLPLPELRSRFQSFLNDSKFNLGLIGRIGQKMGSSSAWGRFQARFAEIRALVDRQLSRRRSMADGGPTDGVLSMMMSARDEGGSGLSDEELRDELVTLVVAGYETTATALAWSIWWLDREPAIRRKLTSRLEGRGLEEQVTDEQLDAFCKEVLRIHPVIPVVARQLQGDAVIGGYELPRGVTVVPCIYLTHHREDLYPEPDVFRPARFLERRYSPYEYLPFGGGARRCIGMALALLEMKVVLSTLLTRVEVEILDAARVEPMRRSVTIAPRGGPRMRVWRRG